LRTSAVPTQRLTPTVVWLWVHRGQRRALIT